VRVTLALAVVVPAVGELMTTVHWPLLPVPVEAQLFRVMVAVAPLLLLMVTVGFAPETDVPVVDPLYAVTVTVKVWLSVTPFVPFGLMEMLAST
jgi:hypothetical protein